jgi:hypothetical protein
MFIHTTYHAVDYHIPQLDGKQEIIFGAPKYDKTKPFRCTLLENFMISGKMFSAYYKLKIMIG